VNTITSFHCSNSLMSVMKIHCASNVAKTQLPNVILMKYALLRVNEGLQNMCPSSNISTSHEERNGQDSQRS
jgi:hypothetical protein